MYKKSAFLITLLFMIAQASIITEVRDYDAIHEALNNRDNLFSRVLGNYRQDGYPEAGTIRSRLAESASSGTPWYNLLMAESSSNENDKSSFFKAAIQSAGTDIGELWGLFLEFHKRNERTYQDEVLNRLERIQLEAGITSLPAISEQLKLLAESEYARNRFDNAKYYLDQVTRFSPNTYEPEVTSLFVPQAKTDGFVVLADVIESVKTSWRTQVALLHGITGFVSGFLTILVLFIFAMLLIRFYPKAIHPLICFYPLSVPYRMRIFFTTLLLAISTVFGVYPVIVLLTILLLRVTMEPRDTLVTRIVAVMILFAPLTGILDSRFNHIVSEKSPIVLYEKALYGQPTPVLYSEIKALSETPNIDSKTKALHLTSMALIQFKQGSLENAVTLIRQAHTLWPSSEQVLMAAGGIYYGFGDKDQALGIFKNAIDSFPEIAEINYNYGQINLEKVGITDGTTYMAKGAELSPKVINGFIKRNSHFFGDLEWPLYRKFFFGTISPNTFWNNFVQFSTPPAGSIQKFWGATFFGLPVQISIGVVIALYIISSLIVPTYFHTKKNGECVLCGKPVCKKCRAGDYCNECQAVLQNISNESLVSALKIKIADSKRIGILIKAHISDILFPGTRDFFLKTKSKKRGYILLPITFIMYAYAAFVATLTLTSFSMISQKIILILLVPSSIYSLIFVLQNLRSLIPVIVKGSR